MPLRSNLNQFCAATGTIPTTTFYNSFIGTFDYPVFIDFNGTLNNVAIWNTALSASAITTLYQHQISN